MYLFCLNSLYRASPACPELLQEMPGITLKTRKIGLVLPGTASAPPAPVTLSRFVFLAGIETADRAGSRSCGASLVRIAARVYNRPKNLSSIARRADSRVTQAACMVIDIDP
jgi:hypothetical protein